jgi:hypothetical protein
MLIGLLLAFGTAALTGVASIVQALAARGVASGDLGRLVLSPLYLSGTALDALGFVCMVGALHWLPLFLVQCAAASSVGVTALVGRRVLGTHLRQYDVAALLGLGTGLVLLAAGAKAAEATTIQTAAQWWLVVAAAPVLIVGLALTRMEGTHAGGVLATVAGLSFAGTAVASRVLSDAHSVAYVVTAPATYALVAFGIGGMAFFAASLQRAPVTIATAALFGVETLAASAVGLIALGDATRHGFKVLTAVGFAITLGSALALALSEAGTDVGQGL